MSRLGEWWRGEWAIWTWWRSEEALAAADRESRKQFGGVPGHVWVSQQRIIQEADYRKTLVDWVAANGINPSDVPGDARASVADGQLTIPVRVHDKDGKFVIDRGANSVVTETVTVPVKVKPNSDVELWLMPRCETCGR